MVDVESQVQGVAPGGGAKHPVRVSRLNIVDLAGAERLAVSGTGDNPVLLAETQSINSSLTALGASASRACSSPAPALTMAVAGLLCLLARCATRHS